MDKHSEMIVTLTSVEVKRLNKIRKKLEENNSSEDEILSFKITKSNTCGIGDNVYVEAFKSGANRPKEQVMQKTEITDYGSW